MPSQARSGESHSSSRPRSPHLSVYKPQLTSILSIIHRFTGVALAAGTALVSYWLIATMAGEEQFSSAYRLLNSVAGRFILICWSWALFYHLGNGVRHLFWDMGLGLDLKVTYCSGAAVIVSSALLTLLLWTTGE